MSEEDRKFMMGVVGKNKKVDVVENGVDIEFFRETKKKLPKDPTVLFVGTFKWLPNIEAVRFLVSNVWPEIRKHIANAKLHIVGNSPTKSIYDITKNSSEITVSGNIQDIRDAYASAYVLLAPVFSGKGTRYKVLEAMATRTPVVGTTLALEGLRIHSGVQALIGNTAHELATHTVQVLQDEDVREELAKQGETLVFNHYNWKDIANKLDGIYKEVGRSYE